jgi:hypothetical protein
MMIKKIVFLFVLIFGFNFTMRSQEHEQDQVSDHREKEPGLELVLSGLTIYNTENKASDLATEVHVTYWTSHKWAFGIGYTFVFEEENSIGHEVAAIISHKPWSFLTLNAGPSFSLPNSHKATEVSAYLEGEFAFKFRDFHTGPTIGTLVGEDLKIFGGWHFSYEF